MDGQECSDLEALVQDEIEQAVSQAEAGLLPVAEVGAEADGPYREMVRQVGGTTYIVRIFEGDETSAAAIGQEQFAGQPITEADISQQQFITIAQPEFSAETVTHSVPVLQTEMFNPATADAETNVPEPGESYPEEGLPTAVAELQGPVISMEPLQPSEPLQATEPNQSTESSQLAEPVQFIEPIMQSTEPIQSAESIVPSTVPSDSADQQSDSVVERREPVNIIPAAETQSTPMRSRRTIKKPARLMDTENDLDVKPAEKVVKLPKVTCSNLDVDDLFIEVEIDRDLFVSELQREEVGRNMYRYRFRVSSTSFTGAFPHEERIDKTVKETPKARSKAGRKSGQSSVDATLEVEKSKRGRPRKIKVEEADQTTATSSQKGKQPVKDDEAKTESVDASVGTVDVTVDISEVAVVPQEDVGIKETDTDTLEEKETAEAVVQTVKSEGAGTGMELEELGELAQQEFEGDSSLGGRKNSLDEDGSVRKKRKYTKRNAYSQDDSNYTVRKNDKGKAVYKCNTCGIEMRWPGNMRDHLRTHSRECPFVCTYCGKGFTNQANFNHHVPIHSDERPYICDICGFSFKIKRALTTHYRRHVSSGNHVCQICGKRFHSSTEVNKHTVLHTGERNYECKICGKKFKQGSALYRHKFTHSTEGKHNCMACGLSFGRKDYYRTHLMKNHSDLIGKEEWVNEILNATHLTPAMMKKERKEVIQVEQHAPQVIQYEIVDSDGHRYEAQIENLDVPIANSEIEIATNKITFVLADGTVQ